MVAEAKHGEDVAREAVAAAERAGAVARVSLIIACMAIAVAILGLFLPI